MLGEKDSSDFEHGHVVSEPPLNMNDVLCELSELINFPSLVQDVLEKHIKNIFCLSLNVIILYLNSKI